NSVPLLGSLLAALVGARSALSLDGTETSVRAQIEVLGEVFTGWLRIHDLDYDYRIYSADEWVQREGPNNCLRGAELILVFENSLVRFLEDGSGIHDELQDLAEGFGYYF